MLHYTPCPISSSSISSSSLYPPSESSIPGPQYEWDCPSFTIPCACPTFHTFPTITSVTPPTLPYFHVDVTCGLDSSSCTSYDMSLNLGVVEGGVTIYPDPASATAPVGPGVYNIFLDYSDCAGFPPTGLWTPWDAAGVGDTNGARHGVVNIDTSTAQRLGTGDKKIQGEVICELVGNGVTDPLNHATFIGQGIIVSGQQYFNAGQLIYGAGGMQFMYGAEYGMTFLQASGTYPSISITQQNFVSLETSNGAFTAGVSGGDNAGGEFYVRLYDDGPYSVNIGGSGIGATFCYQLCLQNDVCMFGSSVENINPYDYPNYAINGSYGQNYTDVITGMSFTGGLLTGNNPPATLFTGSFTTGDATTATFVNGVCVSVM